MRGNRACIVAENIAKTFAGPAPGRQVLFQDLSLECGFGEIIGIGGASGSGKTTLGDILIGLVRPDRGRVRWAGLALDTLKPAERRRLRPRYQKIYQDPSGSFPPWMTIRQALADVLEYHGLTQGPHDTARRLARTAGEVGLDEYLLDRYPGQLSGGEVQRFALARTLLLEPYFLVADEPTSRLDPSVQALIARLIMTVARERNMGVLLISHDPALLDVVCDRVFFLQDGRLTRKPCPERR